MIKESNDIGFWECKWHRFLFTMFKSASLSIENFADLRMLLRKAIKIRLPNGVLVHQDNALAHKTSISMAYLSKFVLKLVDYPDFPLSDYNLSANVKKNLTRNQYGSNFYGNKMKTSSPIGCNTDEIVVWTARGAMLKNKIHLNPSHENIFVSLWTFQLIHIILIMYLLFGYAFNGFDILAIRNV